MLKYKQNNFSIVQKIIKRIHGNLRQKYHCYFRCNCYYVMYFI